MRAWAILAVLVLAGCSEPPAPVAETEDRPIDNFEQKDEGDEGVEVQVEDKGSTEPVDPELFVTVKEPGGQPLADAAIDLLGTALSKRTDEDGTAHFPNITAGKLRLRVSPAQDYYKIVEVNLTIRTDAITRATVTVPVADGLLSPPHKHDDAWVRGDRVELFEESWDIDCIGLMAVCHGPDSRGRFAIPKAFGAPVPPGTGTLEVTLTYDSPTSSDLGVTLYPARGFSKPVAVGASGETVAATVEPDQADAPHAMSSAWLMELTVATTTYQGVWFGPITINVVALRGDFDLPLDPPHPDLWGKATQKRLADHEFSGSSVRNPSSPFRHDSVVDIGGSYGFRHLDEGALVIPGAAVAKVQAWINDTVAWPYDMVLELDPVGVSGPDGWPAQVRRHAPAAHGGAYWEYWVEVDPAWYDGIYEERSKWRYRLLPEYDPATQSSVVALEAHVVIDLYRVDPR